ncbi:DNA gyrase inhibitor YacG [Sphingomonas bacterium]|uniref:DNA gyrase inhibitor YacG n=1 Tax=Sphingomonas bacterium TaxID=1895847 RepID=UPI003F689B5B
MPSATMPREGCPNCGKPAIAAYAPFCGQGCKDRDLLQWLSEGHRLPGPPADPETLDGLDRDEG